MDIHTLFIHLAIEGHLSCFQLGAIMNKAALYTHVQSPYRHMLLFLLGTFLGVVLVLIQALMLIQLQKKPARYVHILRTGCATLHSH